MTRRMTTSRLGSGDGEHDYKSLRRLAAAYIMEHENHFKHFLSLEKETFQVTSLLLLSSSLKETIRSLEFIHPLLARDHQEP